MQKAKSSQAAELEDLRSQLAEARELLRAIHAGEVDAVVVSGPKGEQVFTLEGADRAYRVLIEAMNEGALTLSTDGTVLYCNHRFAEMLKTPLERIIGKSIYGFLPPDEIDHLKLMQKQGIGQWESRAEANDGSIIPVLISVSPLQLDESQQAWCLIVTDLTEQKRSEEIVASERLARSMIENASEAIVVCDAQGRIIRFNKAASEIAGSDLSLKRFGEIFDLQNAKGTRINPSPISSALQDRVLQKVEAVFERGDGRIFYLLVSSGSLKNSKAETIGSVVTLYDLTDRTHAEEALVESENKYRVVANNTYDFEFWLDPQGNYIYASPSCERIYGYTHEDFASDPLLRKRTIHPEDYARFEEHLRTVEANHNSGEIEFRIIHADGTVRWIGHTCLPIFDEKGCYLGVRGSNRDITERKKAEEELRKSEEKSRLIVKHAPSMIYEIDFRGPSFKSVNDAICSVLGYSREELLAMNPLDLLEAESKEIFQERMRKYLAGEGLSDSVEYAARTKEGRLVYGLLNVSYTNEEGKPIGALVVAQDITERKVAEESLRRKQAEIQALFDNIPAGLVLFDAIPPYTVLTHNRYYQELFAEPFRCQGMVGLNVYDYAPEVEAAGVVAVYDEVVRTKQPKSFLDFPYNSNPPKESWFNWYMAPIILDDHVIALVSMSLDVTDRHRTEETLRETKDYLENLIDYANAPIIVWDTSFNITRFNYAFEQLTGLRAVDVVGRHLDVLFPEENKEASLDHIRRTLCGERWETVEIPVLRADGSIRDVLWNSANIYDQKETSIVATIAQGQDVTERKRAEDELRKARDTLELRVQERTEELEAANEELRIENEEHLKLEEALRMARDAAEAAVLAKADFMANMSHEIRTPMNAVIGMTSILLEESLTPEQKDFVETIRSSGNALLVIINDILDFSRLDREKAELEEQFFDLRSLVEESLDQIASQAAEKGINLAYIMATDVPETIYSDPARLRQVLLNLLNNAIKFTDGGEILVSIGYATAGVRHEIRFSVQDTGMGISEENLKKIFEPFSQADTSLARNHDGVGLGLAISKKLVELMGGKISVKSEPGKGSCFRFNIMAKVLPGEPRKVPTGVQPALRGKRVLIIDESKANRMILGRLLHEWGVTPLVVASVKDARESGYLNYGQDYDAAIIGVNLEEPERTALVGRMREKNKGLPMILLAHIGTKPTMDFAAVLPLPIKALQLFSTMVSVFTLAPAKDAARDEDQAKAGHLRILLAEDNASSQKVTLQMLKKLGYRADLAANGQEAVEALKRQHYDLVLMDVKMPVMNGWDATREIRRLWPENGPKIIALTAYALAGDREKCLGSGMDGYIAKPVALEDLKRILKETVTN